MADNQIKISVNLDSKEFDNNFKRIMNQLNEMRKASSEISRDMGNLGGGGPNSGNFDKSLKNLQTTLSNITDRTNTFDKSLKSLSQTLDDLSNKTQAAATSTSQAATAQQQQTTTQQPAPAAAGGGGGGIGGIGGIIGGAGGGGGFQQLFSLAKILGTVGTAVTGGGQLYKQIATYPERIAQREATMADMMSESARLQAQGRGYEMSLFGPERAKALERASTRVGAEKVTDVTSLAGTVLGGATLGGGLAAKFASPLLAAPMGLGLPLYAGAVGLGALGGGAMAFGGNMINDRKRSMLFDQEGYQKEMGAVFAGTYEQQLKAEKARSYQKDLAAQFLERESGRFRTLQRGFGLSDEELFMGDKSIFGRLTGSGQRYEMGDITQAMQGISAAGGTKGIATGEGLQTALQMQRNLGLTNAPELMGRVSGVTGMGAEGSKEQIFRMFAEASRAKLELPQARQFTEAATEMGYRTGGDFDTISRLLSAGVQGTGLQSARGIEAAQSAFEQFRQRTGESGGLTGQYKLANLFNKGLDTGEANYISELPIDQITEEDPIVKNILEKIKKTNPNFDIKQLRKEMTSATFRRQDTEEAAQAYATAKQKYEADPSEENKAEMEKTYAAFGTQRGMEIDLPKDLAGKKAALNVEAAAVSGVGYEKAEAERKKYEEQIKKQYEKAPSTLETEKSKSAASDAQSQLYNLSQEASKLRTAFSENEGLGKEVKAAAAGLQHLATLLKDITDVGKKAELQEQIGNIQKLMGGKQPASEPNMSTGKPPVSTNGYSSKG